MDNISPAVLAIVILAALVFFSILMMMITRYKRCPSNRVLVIFGKFTGSPTGTRCLHGGARLVLPLVQDYAYLNLEPIQIEIPLKGALSMENIRVSVPSVFTVAVGTDVETMQNAAIRLLGLNVNEVKHQASDIILGQLRQVGVDRRQLCVGQHEQRIALDRLDRRMRDLLGRPPLHHRGNVLLQHRPRSRVGKQAADLGVGGAVGLRCALRRHHGRCGSREQGGSDRRCAHFVLTLAA